MAPVSPELVWECVKSNNSFMRKSPGAGNRTMSAEAGNLCSMHSFKFSGIANDKVLGMHSRRTGKKETIIVTTRHKKPECAAVPKRQYIETGLKKDPEKGLEALAKIVDAGYNSKDL